MLSWKLSVLEIPLDKKLTTNCLVKTLTKLEELISAVMIKYGLNRVHRLWITKSGGVMHFKITCGFFFLCVCVKFWAILWNPLIPSNLLLFLMFLDVCVYFYGQLKIKLVVPSNLKVYLIGSINNKLFFLANWQVVLIRLNW